MPFRQFLLKIHSRCNLACDYCYVYEAADQSWRGRPRTMDLAVVRRTAELIAEHVRSHRLSQVSVILHGGEPLLVGPRHLDATLRVLADALAPATDVRFKLQTNGLLLESHGMLEVLHRYGVQIGVSLDGTAAVHDRHRRDRAGQGSHARTAQAVRTLARPEHRRLFAGLLCTVDLDSDPLDAYEALLAFDPPQLDLLLPHGTWQYPPPGLSGRTEPPLAPPPTGGPATPYADWLCAVFDRWYGAPLRETGIRLFEEALMLLLGGKAASEVLGLAPVDLVVVETDGSIEQADSLKIAYDGAPTTGLDVFRHSFEEAAQHPAFLARQRGRAGLGPVCSSCPLARACGGGLYAHRHHPAGADPFAHPSVYCADLAALLRHIRRRIDKDFERLSTPAEGSTAVHGRTVSQAKETLR